MKLTMRFRELKDCQINFIEDEVLKRGATISVTNNAVKVTIEDSFEKVIELLSIGAHLDVLDAHIRGGTMYGKEEKKEEKKT